MKPLHVSSLESFKSRFDNFMSSEIKSVSIMSPTVIQVRCSVQDTARSFDWIDVNFELSNVRDAKLLENEKLKYLDMQEGLSILFSGKETVFTYGLYETKEGAKESAFYIVCETIKYEEMAFSG